MSHVKASSPLRVVGVPLRHRAVSAGLRAKSGVVGVSRDVNLMAVVDR